MGQDRQDRQGRPPEVGGTTLGALLAIETEADLLVEAALPWKLLAVLSGIGLVVLLRTWAL